MVSTIWDHFTKDNVQSRCKYCSATYVKKHGSTSNLWRHMEAKHSVELAASKASFDELCMKILRLITVDNAAFRLVDRPEFHALFPPHTRMPTRYHLSKVVMPSMVQSLRDDISSRLAGRRCTLTVDQWTSKGGRITLSCFNAHYVNDKGELASLVISVPPLDGRHTADNLRVQMEEVINRYNLDVAAIVTDSASNIRKAVRDMSLFNPRCAAHQLHLAVTNSITKWSHGSELADIKNFARILNKSSSTRAQYFQYCSDFSLPLLCSETCLLTEVAFIFPEIIHEITMFIDGESGPCIEFAKLLLEEMKKRVEYYTASDEMKNLLFFDPRSFHVYHFNWKEIGRKLLSSAAPTAPITTGSCKYAWFKKATKTTNLTPINEEIERYIYENSRRVVDVDNSVKYWLSPAGSFYPTIKDMALKMLPIPATSVSAERVFSAAGLLDKQRLRNNLSAETIESCLLLRLNYIGDRARELSCKPPPVLVPNSSCTSIDSPSAPVEETYGYLSDDSEIEEFESDDELEL